MKVAFKVKRTCPKVLDSSTNCQTSSLIIDEQIVEEVCCESIWPWSFTWGHLFDYLIPFLLGVDLFRASLCSCVTKEGMCLVIFQIVGILSLMGSVRRSL
jgi:hypothetical protein